MVEIYFLAANHVRIFGLCSLVCRLSVICDVLYCGKTVRPSEKLPEGVNRKPGSKSWFFRSPPYFYFRFRCYVHRDGRFCLIFAHTAQQSILDGTNWLSSSKPCAYCRNVWSELKPAVVLATIIDPGVNSLKIPTNGWDCLAYKFYWCYCVGRPTILLRRSVHLNGLWVIGLHYVAWKPTSEMLFTIPLGYCFQYTPHWCKQHRYLKIDNYK